jgi:hypothetical protein
MSAAKMLVELLDELGQSDVKPVVSGIEKTSTN